MMVATLRKESPMRRRFLALAVLVTACLLPVTAQQTAPRTTPLQRLQAHIERIAQSVNAEWGIYIKSLETNEEIAINADKPMDTMSVIKIPLMVEAFTQIEAGKFKLGDHYSLKKEDFRPGTGIIQYLDEGDTLTVKDLLTLMINVSDNTATDLMYARVGGPEAVTRAMQAMGLQSIKAPAYAKAWFDALRAAPSRDQFHRDGLHPFGLASPRDIGRLLEKIERGEAVSRQASDLMLQMMRSQLYRTRIPKYVTGFQIPHKTGDFLPYIGNDVGVLESADGRQHIIMSVFTAHHFGVGTYLEDAIGRIAEQVADYYSYR